MISNVFVIALQIATTSGAAQLPIDQDCSTYESGSTYDMVECYGRQSSNWDRRLNEEYGGALKRADKSQLPALRTAQRLWLKYRSANCEMYALVDGSISRILAARCWRDMNRDRALELREMSWSG